MLEELPRDNPYRPYNPERLQAYLSILATSPDGERRANVQTQPGQRDLAMAFIQRCQAVWIESRMLRRGDWVEDTLTLKASSAMPDSATSAMSRLAGIDKTA